VNRRFDNSLTSVRPLRETSFGLDTRPLLGQAKEPIRGKAGAKGGKGRSNSHLVPNSRAGEGPSWNRREFFPLEVGSFRVVFNREGNRGYQVQRPGWFPPRTWWPSQEEKEPAGGKKNLIYLLAQGFPTWFPVGWFRPSGPGVPKGAKFGSRGCKPKGGKKGALI